MIKKITTHIGIIFLLFFIIGNNAIAFSPINDVDSDQSGAFLTASGFSATDQSGVGSIVATVIKAFLSLLGIIFVILILVAGYKYMTARGDEGKIEEALESIKRAVIGLIIIIAAYSITAFVFKNLPSSAGSGAGTTIQ